MSISYRKDIDGLRGLSILLVILFHAKISGFSNGFIGVDIFFVISGFLITSIILKDLNNSQFSLKNFYFRRAKRILPVLLLILLAASVLAFLYMLPNDFTHFAKWLLASLVMLPNIAAWHVMGNYFSPAADSLPLLHLWSLGIEEQFYLISPIFLIILVKYSSNQKSLLFFIFLISLFSWLLALWGAINYPRAAFYLLPARSWELLLGSLVAIIHTNGRNNSFKFMNYWLLPLGALLCLVPSNKLPIYIFLEQNLACLFAAIIVLAGKESLKVNQILGSRFLVFIGLISYSLYLWHWLLLSFLSYQEAGISTGFISKFILILLSFLLAFLSWKYVEYPTRKLVFLVWKKWFLFIIAILLSLLVYVSIIISTSGIPSRFTDQQLAYANAATDVNPLRKLCHYGKYTEKTEPNLKQCLIGSKILGNDKVDFLIWGDSHADALTPALAKLGESYKLQGLQVSYSGGSALVNVKNLKWTDKNLKNYKNYIRNTLNFIKEEEIKNVFIMNRYIAWFLGPSPYELSQGSVLTEILYNNGNYKTNKRDEVLRLGLNDLIKILTSYDVNVWLIKPIPEVDRNSPVWLSRNITDQTDIWVTSYPERRRALDNMFVGLKNKYKNRLEILNPEKYLCRDIDQKCIIASTGHSLYCDDDHLSNYGALYLIEMLRPAFEKMDQDKASVFK